MAIPIDACLVAFMPDGTESLGLGYVASALRRAGRTVRTLTFRNHLEMDGIARRAVSLRPRLLGVSIPSGHAAVSAMAFVNRARGLGYRGHVACGGPWATLARERLLRDFPGIDSVVRHDGEAPTVALVERLAANGAPDGIPGVTARAGDGPPAEGGGAWGVAGKMPALRPERSSFRRYAGVRAAKVSAVRGCSRRCRYCGLAAWRREDAGPRRRHVEDVADEMAELYHGRGVRFFHFVDENHLPDGAADALEWVRRLDGELSRRRVGRRAIGMMLRADAASPPVVEALARMGLVRSLLGVESLRQETLDDLGRDSHAGAAAPAMRCMERHGILFHFNVLLVHPGSTLESIVGDVEALRNAGGGLLDPFQVEAFEGTDLFASLAGEGRLRGGPFVWHYDPPDPGAQRFADLFRLVKMGAMGEVPLTAFAYEVLGTLAVARRIHGLDGRGERLAASAAELTRRHNSLWLGVLDELLEAASGRSNREPAAIADRTRREAALLTLEFERLRASVQVACRAPIATEFGMPRAAAAVAASLAILGGACDCEGTSLVGDAEADVAEGAGDDSAPDADGSTPDADDAACSEAAARDEHRSILAAGAACPDPCTGMEGYTYRFVLDAEGRAVDMETRDGPAIPDDVKRCYLDAVAGQVFPCLREHPWWEECPIYLA